MGDNCTIHHRGKKDKIGVGWYLNLVDSFSSPPQLCQMTTVPISHSSLHPWQDPTITKARQKISWKIGSGFQKHRLEEAFFQHICLSLSVIQMHLQTPWPVWAQLESDKWILVLFSFLFFFLSWVGGEIGFSSDVLYLQLTIVNPLICISSELSGGEE